MQTTSVGPTLGEVIRAARLRWRWSSRHGGFIRMRYDEGDASTVIECHPAGQVPNPHKHGDYQYVIWWEKPEILDMIQPLKHVSRVKKPFAIRIDEHGQLHRKRTP